MSKMKNIFIKILVVEDNKLAQMVIKNLLVDLGCEANIAGSGEEGLEKTNQIKYDIIFMDIGLGNTDGFSVTKLIKANSKNQGTPIVALTAHHTQSYQQLANDVGMVDFITKPLEKNKLIDLLIEYTTYSLD